MKIGLKWPQFKLEATPLNLAVLSALLVIIFFIIQGNVGLDIADEGYLWYGTIRTSVGDVPIRDFQAYDPGRYYWGALWFKIFGSHGIIALRISQAIFQFLGLSVAFLLLRRVLRSWLALVGSGIVLMVWMFPPWKIYEPVITILAVYFAVLLIEKPSRNRHLIAGIFVGLAAFFGRNHGVYCFAAFLLLILFVWWKIDRGALAPRVGMWALGVVIGYLPMLLMFALVPGFFNSFVEGIRLNVRQGTNLPLPVPWPWVPNYSRLGLRDSLHAFSIGLLYLALPLFYLITGVLLFLKSKLRSNTLLVACTFVGAMYLHYAFDRAHLYYLAWTIPPFIIGLIALARSFDGPRKMRLTALVWASLLMLSWASAAIAPENYLLLKAKAFVKAKTMGRYHGDLSLVMQEYSLVKADIAGDNLWIPPWTAEMVNGAQAINRELIPTNEGLLIAPYWTTLYPALQRESPLWEIYFLFPQPVEQQERMVNELNRKKVNWAIICHEIGLDGRKDIEFRQTHSYVWQYLEANFDPIQTGRLPDNCQLLHRR